MAETCKTMDVWNELKEKFKNSYFKILMQVACEMEDNTGILRGDLLQ
jgi:hypothetical protein